MTVTAGVLSQVAVTSTTAQLAATAATGGTGPYTYQWYRSTTTGFSPGAGNLISGATALTLDDSGLIPNTTYYYKVVVTDTGHSNDTATYTQLAVTTAVPSLNPNTFAQQMLVGVIDMRFPYNTVSVLVDTTQATALYPGDAVTIVDSADGVPKVIGCSANSDSVLGFINFDIKSQSFTAGMACEISMSGNVIYLYATGAIARGAQVTLDVANHGVQDIANATSGDTIVGWAYDKAAGMGSLIRVFLTTPSFAVK